ncbi:hypothetical protein MASR1M12_40790 [Erysipelotrichia bacterium]
MVLLIKVASKEFCTKKLIEQYPKLITEGIKKGIPSYTTELTPFHEQKIKNNKYTIVLSIKTELIGIA